MYGHSVINNRFTNKMNFHMCAQAFLSGRMCYLTLSVGRDKLS